MGLFLFYYHVIVFGFTALPMNNFVSKLSKDTEYFQQNLELVQYLVKSPVKARHWETILGSSSREVVNTNVLTIAMMINLKVNLLYCSYILPFYNYNHK